MARQNKTFNIPQLGTNLALIDLCANKLAEEFAAGTFNGPAAGIAISEAESVSQLIESYSSLLGDDSCTKEDVLTYLSFLLAEGIHIGQLLAEASVCKENVAREFTVSVNLSGTAVMAERTN